MDVAPLERFTRLVIRFPVPTLVLAGAAVAASLWLSMTQLGFRTSRAELLNPKSDYNRRWLEYTKEFGDKEDVVVVVEGESREQIIPALDDACRELARRSDLFGAVLHDTDAPKLRSKGLYYLKPEQLAEIDGFLNQAGPVLRGDWSRAESRQHGRLDEHGHDGRLRAAAPASPGRHADRVAAGDGRAPGGVGADAAGTSLPGPTCRSPPPAAAEAASTRLMSDDGRMGFILLRLLEEDKQSFAQNSESIKVLRELTAEVKGRHPGTQIGLTGLPIIEHDEMQSSEKSMSAATVLSFLGVLAVMIVAFGGFRHSTMAMVGAGGGHDLDLRRRGAAGRAREHPEHRLRLDPAGAGHRLRDLLRRPLLALPPGHRIDRGGVGGHGQQRGAGHSHRRAHLGHRLLRRRIDGVPRRGPTGDDRRRGRAALLAGPGDRPAGDDPPVRRRRPPRGPAAAAGLAVLAASLVRLSAALAGGGGGGDGPAAPSGFRTCATTTTC